MERDKRDCEQHKASAVGNGARPRRGLAVAAWPTPRRTVRPQPRSAAAETIATSSSSNATAQLDGVKGCVQETHPRSRLHEGSFLDKSAGNKTHGQEGAGDVTPEGTPNANRALHQGHSSAPVRVEHLQERAQDPSVPESLESRRIHEVGAGDAPTERTLELYRASRQGRDLYMHVGGLQEGPQIGRGNGSAHDDGAAVAALYEGARGPVSVPNDGAGVYLYLDPGELPTETADYWTLIRKAMEDQEMTEEELRRLAELILDKGSRDITCASKAAGICVVIIGRQQGQAFLYSLLDTCRSWYEAREEKLPRATSHADLFKIHEMGPRVRVWTAYVTFVVDVLVALSRRNGSSEAEWTAPAMTVFCLAVLLCDCFQLMLRSHALNIRSEMNLFLWAVTTAGKIVDEVAPMRVESVMRSVGEMIGRPQCGDEVRKVLTRVLELRASRWQQHEEDGTDNIEA